MMIWGKKIPDRGNSKCKRSEEGTNLQCWRNQNGSGTELQ